jgi:ribosomal protein L37AE/L43A
MGEATRDRDEIEERIADILGYCRSDGELHDPRDFVEKYAGMRWQCPECDLTISKTSYKRASDLQWVITPRSSRSAEGDSVSFDEMDETELDDEKATLLDNVQEVQERLFSDEESDPSEKVEGLSPGKSVANPSTDTGSDSETDTESDPTPETDEKR